MKPTYFNNFWRTILALIGGLLMIFAAEADNPIDIISDRYFIRNWAGSFVTVWLVLTVQHVTLRITDKICPFKVREFKYYLKRALVQFFVSFIPSLLVAVILAWVLVSVVIGTPLQQTTYFNYDIYIVVIALIGLQFFKGYQHYEWTRWQYEEVTTWNGNGMTVVYGKDDWRVQFPKTLTYQRIVAFLEEWDEDVIHGDIEEEGVEELQESESVIRKSYTSSLEQLDWATVSCFYARDKSNFKVDWEGQKSIWDTSLEFMETYMDKKLFFSAGRHLIFHKAMIQEVKKAGNGQLLLKLWYELPIKLRLSRLKSKEFREWYPLE